VCTEFSNSPTLRSLSIKQGSDQQSTQLTCPVKTYELYICDSTAFQTQLPVYESFARYFEPLHMTLLAAAILSYLETLLWTLATDELVMPGSGQFGSD
jgi:hypothetical protein